ncbi:sugar transferase [Arthrobacter sp. D1-17]
MNRIVPAQRGLALKRVIDATVAGLGLMLTAPLQLVVGLMVWKKLGRPVFFRQPRPGRDGEVFELIKFRSMLPVSENQGLDADAERLTRFGKTLRSTSLDELPTLVNVLRGDMSIVGPRPLLVEYLDRYSPEQKMRHAVRPGITGLAQVRGRNALTWDEKFALDIEYVQRRSLALDIQIILETAVSVLFRRGITAAGSATMPEFRGECAMDAEDTP